MAKILIGYKTETKYRTYLRSSPGGTKKVQIESGRTLTIGADEYKSSSGYYYMTGNGYTGWISGGDISPSPPSPYYETITDPCKPPTNVTVNNTTKKVTISGGEGGDKNQFLGWGVSWREQAAGNEENENWGEWSTDEITAENIFQGEVAPGYVRQYRVRTVGSAGEKYYSEYVLADNLLYGVTAVTAPALVFVTPKNPPYTITTNYIINWRDAAPGISNPITGYEIYRYDNIMQEWVLDGSVETGQTYYEYWTWAEDRPLDIGETLSFKVKTIGTVAGYDSELSTATATATGSYEAVGAPDEVKTSSKKTYPRGYVALIWSGATDDGNHNPITGYEIYRGAQPDGQFSLIKSLKSTAKSGRTLVEAPATVGNKYYFKVKTIGTIAGFSSNLSITPSWEPNMVEAIAHKPGTKLKGKTNAGM